MLFLVKITDNTKHELFIEKIEGEFSIPCINGEDIEILRLVNSIQALKKINKDSSKLIILDDDNEIISRNMILILAVVRYFSMTHLFNSHICP